MSHKTCILCLGLFFGLMNIAEAQLSSNPWLDPNSEEEIEKVYEKSQKRPNHSITNYVPEAPTTIDRSNAYIEIKDSSDTAKDGSFLDKITHPFAKKEETKLVPNTKDNRQIIAEQEAQEETATVTTTSGNSGLMDSLGLGGISKYLPKNMPKFNAKGMIQKFERASGVNFKSIARQMNGGK